MRLDIADVRGPDTCLREGILNNRNLRGSVGRGNAVGSAILIYGSASNRRTELCGPGIHIKVPFQYTQSTTFAPDISSSRSIKSLTLAVRVHGTSLRHRHCIFWRQDEIYASGNCQVRLSQSQALTCQVNRHQRRRTRGINGQTGPFEIQKIGHPISSKTTQGPEHAIMFESSHVTVEDPIVFAVSDSHKHARPASS